MAPAPSSSNTRSPRLTIDAGRYETGTDSFDVVSCIGATWIGGDLAGTLELMRRPMRPGGLLLVGEPFWHEPPPQEAFVALECGPDDFTSLSGTLDRFEAAGLELVEMILADGDSWDRYVAAQWWTIDQWVRAHPDDQRADEMRGLLVAWRRAHLEYGRRYLGWGCSSFADDAATRVPVPRRPKDQPRAPGYDPNSRAKPRVAR